MQQKNGYNKLEKIGNENAFFVPDGYFESLTQSVMDNIKAPTSKTIRVGMKSYIWPMLGYVAGFLILFAIFNLAVKNTLPFMGQKYADQFSTSELEYFSYFNDPVILDVISNENTSTDETMNDATLEAAILASVSDFDLYQ